MSAATVHLALAALRGAMHRDLPRDAADIASRADITEAEAEPLLGLLMRSGLATRRERGYVLAPTRHLRATDTRPGDMYVANRTVWKITGISVDGAHATLGLEDARGRTLTISAASFATYLIYRAS